MSASNDDKKLEAVEEPWSTQVQANLNREAVDELNMLLVELKDNVSKYECQQSMELLEDIVETMQDMVEALTGFIEFTEPNLPEVEPVSCAFKITRGKRKGELCGKLNCAQHEASV